MRNRAAFLLLVAAFALGSWVGWWTVPAVAALWGWLRPAVPRPILSAGIAAVTAWSFWLTTDVVWDPRAAGVLANQLGAIMRVPPPALYVVTLLFPALLAWSAAALACAAAGYSDPRPGGSR
jgi:hypothetical protein